MIVEIKGLGEPSSLAIRHIGERSFSTFPIVACDSDDAQTYVLHALGDMHGEDHNRDTWPVRTA